MNLWMIGEGFHGFLCSKDNAASFLITPACDMEFWALKILILLKLDLFISSLLDVLCICNNDLLDFNRSVTESCCSTGFSCDFSWIFFELQVLIPLLLYLIRSVSAEGSLNCISGIRFNCSFFWSWKNQYMVRSFDSISITQFPTVICSVSAEGTLNRVAHSI